VCCNCTKHLIEEQNLKRVLPKFLAVQISFERKVRYLKHLKKAENLNSRAVQTEGGQQV